MLYSLTYETTSNDFQKEKKGASVEILSVFQLPATVMIEEGKK